MVTSAAPGVKCQGQVQTNTSELFFEASESEIPVDLSPHWCTGLNNDDYLTQNYYI